MAIIQSIEWLTLPSRSISHTNHTMMRALQRNTALFGGMIACGWICAQAAPFMMSSRGTLGPTMLQSQSPIQSTAAVIVCVALSTAIACMVGRVINSAVGLFVLGAGLFVLAGRLSTATELLFAISGSHQGSSLLLVALETLLWAIICLGAVYAVFKVAGPLSDVHPLESGQSDASMPDALGRIPYVRGRAHARVTINLLTWLISKLPAKAFGKMVVAAMLILPTVWLISRSPMKGQVLVATFLGSVVAGTVGRLVAPNIQPLILFVLPICFGALGQVIAYLMLKQPLDQLFVKGDLNPFFLVMPIDYAAGSLMGVSVGLGWARSFLEHEEESGQPEPVTA